MGSYNKDRGKESNKTERFDAVVAANGYCDWPLLRGSQRLERETY